MLVVLFPSLPACTSSFQRLWPDWQLAGMYLFPGFTSAFYCAAGSPSDRLTCDDLSGRHADRRAHFRQPADLATGRRSKNSTEVIEMLSGLFNLRGAPKHVRSDNGRSSSRRPSRTGSRLSGRRPRASPPAAPGKTASSGPSTPAIATNSSTARSSTRQGKPGGDRKPAASLQHGEAAWIARLQNAGAIRCRGRRRRRAAIEPRSSCAYFLRPPLLLPGFVLIGSGSGSGNVSAGGGETGSVPMAQTMESGNWQGAPGAV